jgi:hypothetical protein
MFSSSKNTKASYYFALCQLLLVANIVPLIDIGCLYGSIYCATGPLQIFRVCSNPFGGRPLQLEAE